MRWLVFALLVVSGVTATPIPGEAQEAEVSPGEIWNFYLAWQTFRADLEAALPGEDGEVLLVEGLREEPRWLLRDALRVTRNPEALAFLGRRAARIDDERSIPALRRALQKTPSPATRKTLERSLARMGDATIRQSLNKRLHKGSPAQRWEAAATLALAGEVAVESLEKALESSDAQTQIAAASALAPLKNVRAQKMLRQRLQSTNRYYRVQAAHALALGGDRRAIATLRAELERGGAEKQRVIRSLGFVGGEPERTLLIGTHASLPRGRVLSLRRELLIALGRIALRQNLQQLQSHFEAIDEEPDDTQGLRTAWLQSLGWASLHHATDVDSYRTKVRESTEHTLAGETKVAHLVRRQRTASLLQAFTGRQPEQQDLEETLDAPNARLLQFVRARNVTEPQIRLRRFAASMELLTRLGERLGQEELADPPEAVRATGLGATRAIDGSFLTAWIAGSMAGPLRLDFESPTQLRALHVINGCVDSRSSYEGHARVRELTITINGDHIIKGQLNDESPYFQRIPLQAEVTRLQLEVSETFPGESEETPACIAELRLER